MTGTKETGGAEFPASINDGSGLIEEGMTLRDYFAAKSLAGMLSNEALLTPLEGLTIAQHIAANAYGIADAMIEERQK
jgi:hypothetical protein